MAIGPQHAEVQSWLPATLSPALPKNVLEKWVFLGKQQWVGGRFNTISGAGVANKPWVDPRGAKGTAQKEKHFDI